METVPPSYEAASNRNHWVLVAKHIQSGDFCSMVLVCREWHNLFSPRLWGDPLPQFAQELDLISFRRALPIARLAVRELTHTFRWSPAHGDLHDGPSREWLRDILERLPKLQSLCVSKCPYFDHASLLALQGKVGAIGLTARLMTSNLRLLDASYCKNATAFELAEALISFPNLMYLDLSGTVAARASPVLSNLRHLHELKVLRLRNLDLRDEDFAILTTAIGLRVRTLDVSSNRLTDLSVAMFRSCLASNLNRSSRGPHEHVTSDGDSEAYLRKLLTTGFVDHLSLEDAAAAGIKRLWISRNGLSSTGMCALLSLPSICLLDASHNSTALSRVLNGLAYVDNGRVRPVQSSASINRPEPLTLVRPMSTLTYLRIHHSLVTERVPVGCQQDCLDVKSCLVPPSVILETLFVMTEPLWWLVEERQKRLEHRQSQHIYFHPLMLPQLRKLILTEVPVTSLTPNISQALIAFIQECADEAWLARLEAELDYTLPPYRTDRETAVEDHARNLFPFRTLELEMLQPRPEAPATQSIQGKSWNYRPRTTSVTEDTDSYALWSAAELDFSFFQGHDGKAADGGTAKHRGTPTDCQPANALDPSTPIPTFDVVGELSGFRKKAKEKYQSSKERGSSLTLADAFWDGDIKILRP